MSKGSTPYALRASLLGQAQSVLEIEYHTEVDRIEKGVHMGIVDPKTVTWPSAPTTEEIITEAEKLYAFVQKK